MMDKKVLIGSGISYDDALSRFVGNEKLYEKYLVKFLDDKHMEHARNAFEQGKTDELLGLVHALKGESGTLGLTEFFESCSTVVADLRKNQLAGLAAEMKHMEIAYEKCTNAIREACGQY